MRRSISASVLVTTWSPKRTAETRLSPPPRPKFQKVIADWFRHPDRGEYTSQELAEHCQCQRQTAWQWTRGRRPSPNFHGHIAEFFSLRENRPIEDIFAEVRELWTRRDGAI